MVISSRDNSFVKLVRSLRLHDHREAKRAFVVEGRRSVADAVAAGANLRFLALREGDNPIEVRAEPEQVRVLDSKLFAFVAETESPQGVLAVFETPHLPILRRDHPFYVILDAIADPGNLGTIIRTCAAAGVDALFLGHDCVDWLNGKVVRSAMGAHFRLAIRAFDEDAQAMIAAACQTRVLSDGLAKRTHDQIDWTGGSALIIGSEAHGASASFRAFANASAAIPMAGGVESLNAAVAAGVFVFEAQRQRRSAV